MVGLRERHKNFLKFLGKRTGKISKNEKIQIFTFFLIGAGNREIHFFLPYGKEVFLKNTYKSCLWGREVFYRDSRMCLTNQPRRKRLTIAAYLLF